MADKISKEQLRELCHSEFFDSREDFNKVLEKVAGITAKVYIGYQYYDGAGNYIGDSNDSTVRDLLRNAYIKVED